ncbi:hypothetical protein D9619_005384 [Psilocybe cf. subviscida]|uniref:CTLH domain-containing protein n=1 Tax=Psilocybe cf. subviscida TaxID=2480587 RepID=A0A8H5FBX3_9AGAR|nr:hypothetical protein D9619_005384 [Psilocybe cf. subviscida]
MMRISEESPLSITPELAGHAGPSSLSNAFDAPVGTNGHTNGVNGDTMGNGATNGKGVAAVCLPGTHLYDDSFIDREEFVRLVIQSLRDVGYSESAATLEAESGYTMEAPEVSQFRDYVLNGLWTKAEAALKKLGVREPDQLMDAKFLISQQKYLELLEAKKPTAALQVLRNDIAPLYVDSESLHTLSSFIMCSDPEDLRKRAGWDGSSGTSRQQLLDTLHEYIPSGVMIPQRRFSTLLNQSRTYQRQQCLYHNAPLSSFSLFADHRCNKSDFPSITTTILEVHTNEVWYIEWSHDGAFLASAGKDKSAIIWRRGSSPGSTASTQDWSAHFVLRDHTYAVGCLAWSPDDSVLLTASEGQIKMWNTKTGVCTRTVEEHQDTITAICWLPDGTGFVTGALDRKIIIWNGDGKVRDSWGLAAIRLTDLAVTPDATRLVAIGIEYTPPSDPTRGGQVDATAGNGAVPPPNHNRMIVYDLATREPELSTRLEGDLTSVQTSQDSQFALVNHAPNEIHLWDLNAKQIRRRYEGQQQGHHVIRSCFGGVDGNFIVSGSEDGNVYIWHRDSGVLLEVLSGHGNGSVNTVAWNPVNERMFASCSDDHTIRIWEAPPPGVGSEPTVAPQPLHSGPTSAAEKGKGKMRQPGGSSGVGTGTPSYNPIRL